MTNLKVNKKSSKYYLAFGDGTLLALSSFSMHLFEAILIIPKHVSDMQQIIYIVNSSLTFVNNNWSDAIMHLFEAILTMPTHFSAPHKKYSKSILTFLNRVTGSMHIEISM